MGFTFEWKVGSKVEKKSINVINHINRIKEKKHVKIWEEKHLKTSTFILDNLKSMVHWEDLEGAGGEGGGREDRDGEHM